MSGSNSSDVSAGKVFHFSDRTLRRLLQDPAYVRYLVSLVAPELLEYLDFDSGVQRNRSFIAENLQLRESDVLLRVGFQETIDQEALNICILIEHQSSPEALMRLRMLIYMVRLWEEEYRLLASRTKGQQQWSPILPIVFYTGSDPWTDLMPLTEVLNVPEPLQRFVPTFDILFLDVKRTDSETLTQAGHPFGWLLRVLQEEYADEATFRNALQTATAELTRTSGTHTELLREALNYLILLILHRRDATERDTFIDIIKAQSTHETEVETMAQTAAEALIEQGKAEGIVEGKAEGIVEGKRRSVLQLLRLRFQSVPETLAERIAAIESVSDLDALLEQAMTAERLDDLQV